MIAAQVVLRFRLAHIRDDRYLLRGEIAERIAGAKHHQHIRAATGFFEAALGLFAHEGIAAQRNLRQLIGADDAAAEARDSALGFFLELADSLADLEIPAR